MNNDGDEDRVILINGLSRGKTSQTFKYFRIEAMTNMDYQS